MFIFFVPPGSKQLSVYLN